MKHDTSIASQPAHGEHGKTTRGEKSIERRSDALMPLEAAAKAIFVKANGLPAYQDATGLGKRSEDEKAGK